MKNQERNLESTEPEMIIPSIKYKQSYLEALQEYKEVDEDKVDIEERKINFDQFLAKLEKDKTNEDKDLVPNIQYWLVKGDKYIGKINYRPKLNDQLRFKGGNVGYSIRPSERGKGYATMLMKQIIEKAKNDGLSDLLLTCDSVNEASIKVIEKCGGIYKDGGFDENNIEISRYIIKL